MGIPGTRDKGLRALPQMESLCLLATLLTISFVIVLRPESGGSQPTE